MIGSRDATRNAVINTTPPKQISNEHVLQLCACKKAGIASRREGKAGHRTPTDSERESNELADMKSTNRPIPHKG